MGQASPVLLRKFMRISDKLGDMYGNYYELDGRVALKRAVAARQTVRHITALLPDAPYKSLLDIGAGEGAVLAELHKIGFAQELHALEISESGIEIIKMRNLSSI